MSVQRLLNANVGQPIYNSIMNYNRFEFIKKMIGFDNAAINGRLTNLQHLEVFEMFHNQCAKKITHLMTFLLQMKHYIQLTDESYSKHTTMRNLQSMA